MAQLGSCRGVEHAAGLADCRDQGNVDGFRSELYAARKPHMGGSPILGKRGVARRATTAGHPCSGSSLVWSAARSFGRRNATWHRASRAKSRKSWPVTSAGGSRHPTDRHNLLGAGRLVGRMIHDDVPVAQKCLRLMSRTKRHDF